MCIIKITDRAEGQTDSNPTDAIASNKKERSVILQCSAHHHCISDFYLDSICDIIAFSDFKYLYCFNCLLMIAIA